jgi:hypothetical protein
MYLVLEYAEHGDLLDYIKARGALSDGRAKDEQQNLKMLPLIIPF